MRFFIIIITLALGLVACSGEPTTQSNTQPKAETKHAAQSVSEDARIAAVLTYADWCTSCKILDPKLKAVRAGAPIDGVDYLVIDYTDRNKADFFAQAEAAGVGPAMHARFDEEIFTGLLVLVDLDTGAVVGEIKKSMSEAEIRTTLEQAVAA